MKTTLKTLLVAVGLCYLGGTNLFAQGRINFNNTSSTPLRINDGFDTYIIGTATTARFGIGPASMQIRLYAGLTSSSLSPMLIGTAANQEFVLNTASMIESAQGLFAGGSNLVLPGFDGSQPVFLQFTAMSVNMMYYGQSPIIQVTPTLPVLPATTVFAPVADANHWNGLTIYIPEPATGTLVIMGAVLLRTFRSRHHATVRSS
jgi:hypothetical protein